MSRQLPSKVPGYLLRLALNYDLTGKTIARDLIRACKFFVTVDVGYDNWNGGTYGHRVALYLPIEELAKIEIGDQADIANTICRDLNTLATAIENEFICAVHLEMQDEQDVDCQNATPFRAPRMIDPDVLSFWEQGLTRLFISHRDQHKVAARELGNALHEYGISSFVAHDTIQPMSEWRSEILKGLETMDMMLVYLTDDFEQSTWCQQEVGFALGRDVPIISLKLGLNDPPGFISHVQALRGDATQPAASAEALSTLLAEALGRQGRLQEALVASFLKSPSWEDAKIRFNRMNAVATELTEEQLAQIIEAFSSNDQLHRSIYLTNEYSRLKLFLERTTGRRFSITGNKISEHAVEVKNLSSPGGSDDIPF